MKFPFRRSSHVVTVAERLGELTRYSELKRAAYAITAQQKQKSFRSLAVLSFFPAEGKTLFSAALAIAYAETCRSKVLVVDTTMWQRPKSLILKDCFDLPSPLVDFVSLQDLRQKFTYADSVPKEALAANVALETKVTRATDVIVQTTVESDHALIRKVTKSDVNDYGLIILDTSPINAKNKNNIDPVLVAQLSDASVVVVSRKLLDAADFSDGTQALLNPNLHLIGMISNEDYSS